MVQAGDDVAGYQLVRQLGAGGMGEVFLGQHRVIGRFAAIKVLRAQEDAGHLARFMAEARSAASINHPAIVHIIDCNFLNDGRAYIVMEYLDGLNLRDALELTPPSQRHADFVAALLGQASLGLDAAHARGIVHRDVKPENLFLQRDSRLPNRIGVKVLDFGIAKLQHLDRAGSITKSGAILGTPQYMAPEQCRGARDVDARADIYALGCVAFELLSGRLVFQAESIGSLLILQATERATPLREVAPEVPERLAALVDRMLAKTPGERPDSMTVVADELAGFLGCQPDHFGSWLSTPDWFPRESQYQQQIGGAPWPRALPARAEKVATPSSVPKLKPDPSAVSLELPGQESPLRESPSDPALPSTLVRTPFAGASGIERRRRAPPRSTWSAAGLGAIVGIGGLALLSLLVVERQAAPSGHPDDVSMPAPPPPAPHAGTRPPTTGPNTRAATRPAIGEVSQEPSPPAVSRSDSMLVDKPTPALPATSRAPAKSPATEPFITAPPPKTRPAEKNAAPDQAQHSSTSKSESNTPSSEAAVAPMEVTRPASTIRPARIRYRKVIDKAPQVPEQKKASDFYRRVIP